MIPHIWIMVVFIIIEQTISDGRRMRDIQNLYEARKAEKSLPNIPRTTESEEDEQYRMAHEETRKVPKFDPTLSAQFRFNRPQLAQLEESMWLKGSEGSQMFLQIIVGLQNDKETHLASEDNTDIFLYVIDAENGEIIAARHVIKNWAGFIELADTLYEIRVIMKGNNQAVPISKIIHVGIGVQKSVEMRQKMERWANQYYLKVLRLYEEGVTIFLDSLENWQTIEKSGQFYLKQQWKLRWFSIAQLLVFAIISIAELLYLKSLLSQQLLIV